MGSAVVLERAAHMYPVLTPAQIQRPAAPPHHRDVRAGASLHDAGEQNTRVFVLLTGAIEVVQPIGDREEPLRVLQSGQFTGEINMLSARRSLVRSRISSDGTVLCVDRDSLRTLVQRDS